MQKKPNKDKGNPQQDKTQETEKDIEMEDATDATMILPPNLDEAFADMFPNAQDGKK